MRAIIAIQDNVVSVVEAFNFIGSRTNPAMWDKTEAAAVRLGKRSQVAPEVWTRGRNALQIMQRLAENGTINLLYTNDQRQRVPYFQSKGFWLTAIYPDPVGTGDGMIELDDRYIHPCVIDIRDVIRSKLATNKMKTGPKRAFLPFDGALDEYFAQNPLSDGNGQVISNLRHTTANLEWPQKTLVHERINESRDRAMAKRRRI